tara:strand:- start:21983 stop:23269 length:1287 start_codon:yes stop_codon:yes gene_type:complete
MIARANIFHCLLLVLSLVSIASAEENPLWTALKSVPAQPSRNDGESELAYSERVNSLRHSALIRYIAGTDEQGGLLSDHLDNNILTMESHRVLKDGVLLSGQQQLMVHNIVLKLGDGLKPTIVVAAHLDKVVAAGTGVIDDWSGCIMILNACRSLAEQADELNHNFVFVCFAYEENNLWGSQTFVNDLKFGDSLLTPMLGGLQNIKGMVNLECLGVSGLYGWKEGSTESLAIEAKSVANLVGLDFENRPIGLPVGADSVPFFFEGIPSITIDSLKAPAFPGDTNHDFGKIHSSEDKPSNMSEAKYLATLEFVTAYLRRLDQSLSSAGFQAGYQQLRTAHPTKERNPLVKYVSFGHELHKQMDHSHSFVVPAESPSTQRTVGAAVRIAEGAVALRDDAGWVILTLRDGKARQTRLDDISTSQSGTNVFP